MATLSLIREDGSKLEQITINDDPVVIGRGDFADVKVDDATLSRRHFLIVREAGRYIVEDLNSRNGTCVAGCRVTAAKLRDNDCIFAGRTVFLFKEEHLRFSGHQW
jgi:pSer/pThr/pTyr-binding forkhead associated (FHA) protein